MKSDPLVRANYLARRGKYENAIRILESEENRFYSSFNYYYQLGVCYLYSRAYGKALINFRKARESKMRDPLGLLGLAVLYLNHGDTDRAIDAYLEVLDMDEHNRIAARGLKIIRKHPGPDNISSWVEKGRLHVLYPPMPKMQSSKNGALRFLAVLFIILGLAAGVTAVLGVFPFARNTRTSPTELTLLREELEAPMQLEGSFRYVLTRDQVNNLYNEARRSFTAFRDENARVSLNRILESNGPEPVKNKARLLLSYLETPGFDSLRDRFTFDQVKSEPIVYRDCHIIWRGMASNVDIGQNHTSFDLLVGYDTRRILEGIVRVDFGFAIAVNPERPVEVLGRVIPISSDEGLTIRIQGIALNQAGLME